MSYGKSKGRVVGNGPRVVEESEALCRAVLWRSSTRVTGEQEGEGGGGEEGKGDPGARTG